MKFYGTSAAQGTPSPFCRCEGCENARKTGGKEIRRRSMFRLSEHISLDLGADASQLAIEFGDFYALQHVLVTHTHEDHLAHMMMNIRNMSTVITPEPLNFYFTDKAYDIVDFYRNSAPIIKGRTAELEERGIVAFHRLEFGQSYKIDDITVKPFKGNHKGNMKENCANYLIDLPCGKRLFYGLDTGWYLDETFAALENAQIDIFIGECTFGLKADRERHPDNHMDAASDMLLFDELIARRAVTPQTKVYLTHINHFSSHADLEAFFAVAKTPFDSPVTIAYDGMELDVR